MALLKSGPLTVLVASLLLAACSHWPRPQTLQPIQVHEPVRAMPDGLPVLSPEPASPSLQITEVRVGQCSLWHVLRAKTDPGTPDVLAVGWYRPNSEDALRALARRWIWFAQPHQRPVRLDVLGLNIGSRRRTHRIQDHDYWQWSVPSDQVSRWVRQLAHLLPRPASPPGSLEVVKRQSALAALTTGLTPELALDRAARKTVLTSSSPAARSATEDHNSDVRRQVRFEDVAALFSRPMVWIWITHRPATSALATLEQELASSTACTHRDTDSNFPRAENRWRRNIATHPHILSMDKAQQASVQWLMPVGPYTPARWAAASVWAEVMGSSGLSGRLPADLRERQGLTYAVYADHVIWQPQLALRIRGSARYPQVHALLQGIRDHVRASFSDGGITQEEFERARQQLLWRLRVRQTFLPGHLDRVFRMVSHRWPEDIRDIERLTWPRFLDELAHLRQKPQWIFVAGDRNAMKHQLCEYFTKCIFIK